MMQANAWKEELFGTCVSYLVLQDGLATSHLHKFLAQEHLQDAMEDMFFDFDIRSAEDSPHTLRKSLTDPDKTPAVRGVLWLEKAVSKALAHDGPIAPALVFALWTAVTGRLEHTVMPVFRASKKDWGDYSKGWLSTQRSAAVAAGSKPPETVHGMIRCGFAASRLLRFTEAYGVGEEDVILVSSV